MASIITIATKAMQDLIKSGVDTLTSRITASRASNLDRLDANISSRQANWGVTTTHKDRIDASISSRAGVADVVNAYKFVEASDTIQYAADAEVSKGRNTPMTKVKEILILDKAGTVRVSFDMKLTSSGTVYGQIYINNNAEGTKRSISSIGSYQTFSEDFTVYENDKVQLYMEVSDYGSAAGVIRNFRIKFTRSPVGGIVKLN